MSLHHALDVEPVSEKALYVHESDLADPSQADVPVPSTAQGKPLDRRERLQLELRSQPEDNVRVYIPLDINENAILRRLHHIFWKYGDVSEANEAPFRSEVETLVSQVEIYDQVWFVRDGDSGNHHSGKAHGSWNIRAVARHFPWTWWRSCAGSTSFALMSDGESEESSCS